MLNKIIRYFLENRLVTFLIVIILMGWGLVTSPFGWDISPLPSDPVSVDAIPDIGENQQIVFTQWMGRSPQDIDDQITYPLTTSLLGIPGVKSIRSSSIFGFSSIYIIFNEDVEFYWSRSRILEKLNSLSPGILPDGVQPALGPDATALGQVFWYTIEGRDEDGNVTGGWDLHEIRTVQDYFVKYGLNAVDDVSEVASIGGYVQEYQIDVDPNALLVYGVALPDVMKAVKNSNKDIGAKTIEINKAEYLVRGLGYVKSIEDIEKAVVGINDGVPLRIKDIGTVSLGPSTRRGLLDKEGAEVVGGVVIARYGSNPLDVINNVKKKIEDIASGMPTKILANGVKTQLTIVPFYDRTNLIHETLGTLEEALSLELLITILVVIVMLLNLRASILISSLLPIAVLMVFIAMRYFHIDANIVALSGIAIAIGTMVDLGIVLSENIIKHIKEASATEKLLDTIYRASAEVSSAILTAVSTTIVSFIPVFTMQAAEGKLFRPLAFTKSFALIASLIVVLVVLPTLAHLVFGFKARKIAKARLLNVLLILFGVAVMIWVDVISGAALFAFGCAWFLSDYLPKGAFITKYITEIISVVFVTVLLSKFWMPLGAERSIFINFIFVSIIVSSVLVLFYLLERYYVLILSWCLNNKKTFLIIPAFMMLWGAVIWMGFNGVFGFVGRAGDSINVNIRANKVWSTLSHTFPGVGKEFMPSLDEGSFLFMPTSMPHAGMDQNRMVIQQLDMILSSIPEVELAVGKMGRAETALDPAPISMYETVINYKPEYRVSEKGHRLRFAVDDDGEFMRDSDGELISDNNGVYYRNWRDHIKSPDDIWNEIVKVTKIPGMTSAPKLQPIETRLVMLQTGMRAPMGIKVYGPDLSTIEEFGMHLEEILKTVPSVKSEAVFADRIVGKPYIHFNIDRDAIARFGLSINDVQSFLEVAVGGVNISNTVEGRKRFPIRVRYPRELRDDPAMLEKLFIPTPIGAQVPISSLVQIEYVKGPQMIKSEDTFLVGYVLLDKKSGYAEVEVVEEATRFIESSIASGDLIVPAGVSYKFSGSYENQIRAEKRLAIIVPLVFIIIFLILYFQFKSVSTSLMIFTGIAMAFSGAFVLIWLFGEQWFANFNFFGSNIRDLFKMHSINMSVAVWVGFIALFGIATDDGVLMGTYLDSNFRNNPNAPKTIPDVRKGVIKSGQRRIKPAIITSATTIIALMPVLTSTGRGADIMIPMAIPVFGGMIFASITYFIVPVLYCMREERNLKVQKS
ncbi:MAG: cation transporter [Bacteroidetes bacterium]|nr:MAG: cation transporter [Bacteroidota bacterium]